MAVRTIATQLPHNGKPEWEMLTSHLFRSLSRWAMAIIIKIVATVCRYVFCLIFFSANRRINIYLALLYTYLDLLSSLVGLPGRDIIKKDEKQTKNPNFYFICFCCACVFRFSSI